MNKKKLVGIVSIIIVLSILVGVGIFVLSEHKTSQIKDKLDLGEKYLEELEYEKALAYFMEVLEIDPKNVDAYIGIVDTYVAMGDYEKALEYAKKGYEETGNEELGAKAKDVERMIAKSEPIPQHLPDDFVLDWQDANLEAAMREVTGVYDRDIVYGDVKSLDSLSLQDKQISNISALSNLINLNSLNLENNNISDISSISTLKNMKSLYLGVNNIKDISVLSNLTELENLSLDHNMISDVSPLKNLTKLEYLGLSYNFNTLSDISALKGLTNLKCLVLDHNKISDISIVSNLNNLVALYLHNNVISDISALGGLTKLEKLTLYDNPISDYSIVNFVSDLQ